MGIRGNVGGGRGSGGKIGGGKNVGVWGGLIVKGYGSVVSIIHGVDIHISDFVF